MEEAWKSCQKASSGKENDTFFQYIDGQKDTHPQRRASKQCHIYIFSWSWLKLSRLLKIFNSLSIHLIYPLNSHTFIQVVDYQYN